MTPELLLAALEQWNRHDVDGVLAHFTDDCVYHASVGPDLFGATYAGPEQVREGASAFFEAYPDGVFIDTVVHVYGSHGSAEWTFVSTNAEGNRSEVHGCDLFEFDGALIKCKNAFRKVRT